MEAKTVLIVEDDQATRRMYRIALGFGGFEVIEAADGISALHAVDQLRLDIVVLDLMLPTLSGLVVQQEIAAHAGTRNIPIVIVTGSEMGLDHIDVPCILRKPVNPDQLLTAVQNCLANGTQGAQT